MTNYLLPLLLFTQAILACAPPASPAPTTGETATTIIIFAAASLTDAFQEIGEHFAAANPGVGVIFNFAGSQQLAQQLSQGAEADVFAAADTKQMKAAIQAGRVVNGAQRTFAHNRLVAITPADNPAQITTLQELARPGIQLILAVKEAPVGQYALDFLDKAEADGSLGVGYKEAVLANVVSYEENVRAVLTKVILGEADAGIVYRSDVTLKASHQVQRIDIPDALNTLASYPVAVISNSARAEMAQQFVDYLSSPAAQTVLAKYGFL